MKICIDCKEKVSVERNRCVNCVKVFNKERVKKYYNKNKTRYGIINCTICGEEMIKNRINQDSHGKCKSRYKTINNYNKTPRSKYGNTIARQIIFDLGFQLTKKLVVHHTDENPNNNVLSNFMLMNDSNHGKLHSFLQKHRWSLEKFNDIDLENCWKTFRDQLTTTWLETTSVNVIKITDIRQSAAEPLNENCIYIFQIEEGSEAMHQVPVTDNAVGKDMVQTQNI